MIRFLNYYIIKCVNTFENSYLLEFKSIYNIENQPIYTCYLLVSVVNVRKIVFITTINTFSYYGNIP